MKWRRLLLWIVILIPVIGVVSVAVSVHHFAYTSVPNSYAVWWVADMAIEHMEAHDGRWPTSWDELREPYELCVQRSGQPWTFEELQTRVDVDWNADPSQLAKENPVAEVPPFRVIWLRDGSRVHWEGREPNQMIFEYLKRRMAKEKKP